MLVKEKMLATLENRKEVFLQYWEFGTIIPSAQRAVLNIYVCRKKNYILGVYSNNVCSDWSQY